MRSSCYNSMSKNKQTVAVTHHTNYLIVHPPSQQSDDPETHPHWEMVRPVKIGRNWCNTALVSCSRACTSAPATGAGRVVLSYGGRRRRTGYGSNFIHLLHGNDSRAHPRDFTSPLATSAAFADNPTCKSSLSIETSFWNLN